jgi:hypothetical protein
MEYNFDFYRPWAHALSCIRKLREATPRHALGLAIIRGRCHSLNWLSWRISLPATQPQQAPVTGIHMALQGASHRNLEFLMVPH